MCVYNSAELILNDSSLHLVNGDCLTVVSPLLDCYVIKPALATIRFYLSHNLDHVFHDCHLNILISSRLQLIFSPSNKKIMCRWRYVYSLYMPKFL